MIAQPFLRQIKGLRILDFIPVSLYYDHNIGMIRKGVLGIWETRDFPR